MQCNRQDRKVIRHATWQICGDEEENGHHVVFLCTKARALRYELRATWYLPDEEQFQASRPDWLLLLLNSVDRTIGAHNLLLFWRAWHLRNNIVHGKGTGSVVASANFLTSYSESLQVEGPENGKGKVGEVNRSGTMNTEDTAGENPRRRGWELPPHGWIKVNTDAGFCAETGHTRAGVVIRDASGQVLPTAWQMLRRCASVEEAEAGACLRGVRLTAEWTGQPAIIEPDCSSIIKALCSETGTRAQWDGVLMDIREVCGLLPSFKLQAVRREANMVAHTFAQQAMRMKEYVVKRLISPACVRNLVEREARAVSSSSSQRQRQRESRCNNGVP
jgi:hypothetical protein